MKRIEGLTASLACLLLCGPAFAESTGQSPPPFGGCLGILVIYFCVKRKEQEIGGWLLYFYIQLYVGVVVAALMTFAGRDNFRPSSWSAAPDLYGWFLATTVPAQLILIAQLVFAETLRLSRDAKWLGWLRGAFWLDLLVAVAGAVIDFNFFRDNLAFDALSLAWPLIWLPYLYLSKRVKRVFVLKDWPTTATTSVLGLSGRGPTEE